MTYDRELKHTHSIGLNLEGAVVAEQVKDFGTNIIVLLTIAISIMPGPNKLVTDAWQSVGFLKAERENVVATAPNSDRHSPLQDVAIEDIQVTSGFDMERIHPLSGEVIPHPGFDAAAKSGHVVTAMESGVVKEIRHFEGLGQSQIKVENSRGACFYIHVDAVVEEGQNVERGEAIATVSATTQAARSAKLSTGDHLDARCRDREGSWIDIQKEMGL